VNQVRLEWRSAGVGCGPDRSGTRVLVVGPVGSIPSPPYSVSVGYTPVIAFDWDRVRDTPFGSGGTEWGGVPVAGKATTTRGPVPPTANSSSISISCSHFGRCTNVSTRPRPHTRRIATNAPAPCTLDAAAVPPLKQKQAPIQTARCLIGDGMHTHPDPHMTDLAQHARILPSHPLVKRGRSS
jgi:hypothetical protein